MTADGVLSVPSCLLHRQEEEAAVVAALAELADAGFVETLDWRPVRFVLTAAEERGAGRERDRTGGVPVPWPSAERQVRFHQAYEPTDRDRHDMAQLRRVFGVATYF